MTSEQPVPLKKRALRGSLLTLINHGGNQVLRLVGNLVLTRLLFPEAFGLMALVQSFMIGLEMFSDVGVAPSIIHNKRGDDPVFLNTAWTIQVFRGIGLWLCACLLALPASWFYKEPQLAQMLPVVGLSSLISGLNSTKMATMNRHIKLGRLTILELGCYVISLTLTIILAWLMRSVWALVLGSLVGAFIKMLASHLFLEGERNYFCWSPEAYKELRSFGQWIFFSTAMGYLASQGDRLIMGRLLDVSFLGIYVVALSFSLLPTEVTKQAASRVLFPSYAEIIRERPERLYPTLKKSRLILLLVSWGASLFLVFFGSPLIRLLYDQRYADAAWMLPVLAIGTLGMALTLSYDGILLATGNSKIMAILLVIQTTIKISAIFIGNHVGGQHGVIIGLACVSWLYYPFDAIALKRLSMWQPEIDLPLIGFAGAAAALAYFTWGLH